jgi:hypothetical protein
LKEAPHLFTGTPWPTMDFYEKPRKKKDKAKEKLPYSSKHVRQIEAMQERAKKVKI